MQPIIWGTAGHIDHGKTALMKALTGTDTDRLEEEQARGLTIDIGFAFLTDEISFIDVPGHEKFVKNMVTGVSTIDAGLLVVAADDGVMPQTKEHLGIMQLLGISAGCVAITKIDLVEDEWLELVEEAIREQLEGTFLAQAPIVRTSAETGEGIAELKATVLRLSETLPRRMDRGLPRLPVDRVFSVKGFGTVVTGSVLSGAFQSGQQVEVLPLRKMTKIRGMQTHSHPVQQVKMSERAALNLSDVEVEEIHRGAQVTASGYLQVSDEVYGSLQLLAEVEKPLLPNQRIRLHLGTTEVLGRCSILSGKSILPGESGLVKFRLEEPAIVGFGDRFIIRFYSPMFTLGGGKILYPGELPHVPKGQLLRTLAALQSDALPDLIAALSELHEERLLSLKDMSRELFFAPEILEEPVNALVQQEVLSEYTIDGEQKYGHAGTLRRMREHILERVADYHQAHPKQPGYPRSQLLQELGLPDGTGEALLRELEAAGALAEEGPLVKAPGHRITLTDSEQARLEALERHIRTAGLTPPTIKDLQDALSLNEPNLRQYLQILQYQKKVLRIAEDYYLHADAKNVLKDKLREYFTNSDELSVGDFKDLTGGTRKYAIPLLEYSDQAGWTRREAEVRKKHNL